MSLAVGRLSLDFADDSSDPILELAYDAERGILYSLSRASVVQMYDLGEGGDAFRFVAAVEARALLSRLRTDGSAGRDTEALRKLDADVVAGEKARSGGADAELHCAIVAISPLAIATSNLVQLVLTTASGVRIYLQTVPAAATNPKARPVHLRPLFALPPPRAADSKPLRCMRGSVLCAGEVTLLASGVDDSPQRAGVELLCLADLPLPSFERPAGSASSTSAAAERCALGRLRLQGAILAVAQETAGRAVDEPASYELVEQHAKPPRGYAVLTSDGVQRLRKRRPVDELHLAVLQRAEYAQHPPLVLLQLHGRRRGHAQRDA